MGKAPSNLPSQLTDGEAGPKRPVPLLAENGTLLFDVCEDVFQRVREGAQIFFRDVEGREKAQDDFVAVSYTHLDVYKRQVQTHERKQRPQQCH